ncbi:MAG: cytochrome c oxidase assembly protein [Gammaproteobacteria bacterium]|jgi:cytochrome c oxidase assembly protein subunit 11|nr:cytochrome c oxidase assembly protein [Gammaproteobacteria bacterium]MBL6819382.1 cytochrome c oxidase assembly protein [Gammaproteobacteria bacterium]MBL6898347.1 cytochrome c oxidase assembly protein [Gammaproteobacteria bacterium]|tara:strand:- start:503 stop:1039 length:537 start_codon:yes stop_codon:yes gene_type:complete
MTGIKSTITKLSLAVVAMYGFSYALVPIYDTFCEITGLNGKTNEVAYVANDIKEDNRFVTVKFISNVANSAPLYFEPSVSEMTVQVGKPYNTHYVMKNNSSKQLHTTASPSVTPGKHAEYFKKIECFCFNQQTINAGEVKDLGIQFIIDNELPNDSGDIVLSYTMFDISNNIKETNKL